MNTPNLSTIELISKGNDVFKTKLIRILKEELPLELDRFEKHVKKKEFIDASACVHKLKHKISLLKMEDDYKVAQQFEIDLLKGKMNLHQDFMVIVQNIAIFLSSFKNT